MNLPTYRKLKWAKTQTRKKELRTIVRVSVQTKSFIFDGGIKQILFSGSKLIYGPNPLHPFLNCCWMSSHLSLLKTIHRILILLYMTLSDYNTNMLFHVQLNVFRFPLRVLHPFHFILFFFNFNTCYTFVLGCRWPQASAFGVILMQE